MTYMHFPPPYITIRRAHAPWRVVCVHFRNEDGSVPDDWQLIVLAGEKTPRDGTNDFVG